MPSQHDAEDVISPTGVASLGAGATLSEALAAGSDSRLTLKDGRNKYYCPTFPMKGAVVRGSCTSSPPTTMGYDAAKRVWDALDASADMHAAFETEMDGVRARLAEALGLPDGCAIVLAASGTDAEYVPLVVARELMPAGTPICSVLAAAEEVGSGCAEACAGAYFDAGTPYKPGAATKGERLQGLEAVELVSVSARDASGAVIDTADALAETLAARADAAWVVRRVVGTKTGFETTVPPAGALPAAERVFSVVDACQLRVGVEDVRRYLDEGSVVLLTGSKFMQGAAFSGAAVIPPPLVERLRAGAAAAPPLPAGFADFFGRCEVPAELAHWRAQLHARPNLGLLLRWHTALPLIEAVLALPTSTQTSMAAEWVGNVSKRVEATSCLEVLATDCGIVSIACKRPGGAGYYAVDELKKVHKWIASDMSAHAGAYECKSAGRVVFIGQPVTITKAKAVLRIALGAELLLQLRNNAYAPSEDAIAVEKLAWAIESYAQLVAEGA